LPKIAILSRNLPSWGTRCQKSKVAAAITPMTAGFYRGAPPWRALINDDGDRDEMGGFDPEIWEDMWIQQHEVGLKPMMSQNGYTRRFLIYYCKDLCEENHTV
jgi:hypothetical protein